MKQLPPLIVVLLIATYTSAHASAPTCKPIPPEMKLLGPVLTIPEVEAIGVKMAQENSAVPQVPFAYANAAWLTLKRKIKHGDQLREYSFGPSGGYAATREGCLVGIVGTWLN